MNQKLFILTPLGKRSKRLTFPKRTRASFFHDESLIFTAKRQLEDYIPMAEAESNIFGSPEAKIDPDYYIAFADEKGEQKWERERKQMVCCIVQQLYAEYLGLA